MKYIIEIEDEPLVRHSALHGETAVYRAKGFKSLVFDQNGLEKLQRLDDVKKDVCIGDEVRYKSGDNRYLRGVVLNNSKLCGVDSCAVWWGDGDVSFVPRSSIEKTGIHYTHFAEAPSYLRRG